MGVARRGSRVSEASHTLNESNSPSQRAAGNPVLASCNSTGRSAGDKRPGLLRRVPAYRRLADCGGKIKGGSRDVLSEEHEGAFITGTQVEPGVRGRPLAVHLHVC